MSNETKTTTYVTPRVNIIDRADVVLLEVELPGVAKGDVELEAKDGELTLTGRRHHDAGGHGSFHIAERPRGDYRRTFALSKAIDTANIGAALDDGVLTVTLQKAEELQPKKITIK